MELVAVHGKASRPIDVRVHCDTELAGRPPEPVTDLPRATVRGKFLFVEDKKFWVKGVTYGTFRPNEAGINLPSAGAIDRDFAAMARVGINSVRLYTVPPRWVLDLAASHGLRVMVGMPWE
jgi:hypothetical protein